MRRGVRVRTHQHDTRLTEPEFGPGDMKNALPIVAPAEPGNPVFIGVLDQQLDHVADFSIGHAGNTACPRLRIGWYVMI